MALQRFLVESTVISRKTKQVIGKSCGIIIKPSSACSKMVKKNMPKKGYDTVISITDTNVSSRLEELKRSGVSVIKFK